MVQFLLRPENMPFTVALGVLVGLAALELISVLLGFALSGILDNLFHGDVDVDVDVDVHGHAHADIDHHFSVLEFLGFGKAPILVTLSLMLATFGGLGLAFQAMGRNATGTFVNPWAASAGALVLTIPIVRVVAGFLGKHLFKDESQAVSEATFVGKSARIVLGSSEKGRPTQAKLVDKFGHTHYLLVEPMIAGDVLQAGAEVLLVERVGNVFAAVENTVDGLNALSTYHEKSSEEELEKNELR